MPTRRRSSTKLRAAATTVAYEHRIGPRARELLTELVAFREFLEANPLSEGDRAMFLDGRAWMHISTLITEIERLAAILRKR